LDTKKNNTSKNFPKSSYIQIKMNTQDFAQYGYHTPTFSLKNTNTWARIVACHDGDSPTIVFNYAGNIHKFHTRLYGIDTPEITHKDPSQKERAIQARNRLLQLCTQCNDIPIFKSDKDVIRFLEQNVHVVWVECMDFDKYGRLLVHLKKHPEHTQTFSDILIQENYALSYFGGKKTLSHEVFGVVK
jgi:endonuclease YncB( thermonuclease family)